MRGSHSAPLNFEQRLAKTAGLEVHQLRFYTTLLLAELGTGTRLERKDIERLRKKIKRSLVSNKKLKFTLLWTEVKK